MRMLTIVCAVILLAGCRQNNQPTPAEPVVEALKPVDKDFNEQYGKPLIQLTIGDPFEWIIGANNPRFVMYEKGQIIYRLKIKDELKYVEVTLSQEELREVIDSFAISDAFYDLDSSYSSCPGCLDLPTHTIIVDLHSKKKCAVYGSMKTTKMRNNTPKAFVDLYDKIMSYEHPKAKAWFPPTFEIHVWDYSDAPRQREWIEGFPDLNSPSTKKIDDNNYILYLDSSNLETYTKYDQTIAYDEAVVINGRKMQLSQRISLPNIKHPHPN